MTIGNTLLLFQTAVHTVSAIVSLCVWIPIGLHLYQFCGHCLLYTDGDFIEEDGSFDPNWSSTAYCGFTVFVGIAVFLTAFVQLIRKLRLLCKGIDCTFLVAFIDALIALIVIIIVLIDAVIVTKGFAVWCHSVTQRCETASSVMIIGKNSGINPKSFFIELGSVQFGIWSLLVCWVLTLVLASRKLFVYHERENIIVSMARERQRHTGPDYTTLSS